VPITFIRFRPFTQPFFADFNSGSVWVPKKFLVGRFGLDHYVGWVRDAMGPYMLTDYNPI